VSTRAGIIAAPVGPAGAPGPPAIEAVLPAVATALAAELGCVPADVRVLAAHRRTHSATWELAADGERYILKWLPRRAARERELAARTRRLFDGDRFIRTPAVACNPTSDTFLVEKLAGRPLQSLATTPPLFGLSAWTRDTDAMLGRVGDWLRRFHDADAGQHGAPLEGVRAYLLNREPALDVLTAREKDALWRMFEAAGSTETVRVHGDFTPHNVLVEGASIAVIDFAGINELERATRCFDAAAMVVGLEEAWRRRRRNYLRFSRRVLDRLVRALMARSGVHVGDGALPVCYAVRHLTRVYNILRTTGRLPGPRNWHVRRVRLAIEQPEAIQRFVAAGAR
jgi:aminoglycoside phosphotransferase (APT) family kinase protein